MASDSGNEITRPIRLVRMVNQTLRTFPLTHIAEESP